jgi:hypothetical protein
MLPIWLKNSKGQYRVSPYLPIANYFHLLVTLDEGQFKGRKGFKYADMIENQALHDWVSKHDQWFEWTAIADRSNRDIYMLKIEEFK